MTIEIGGVSGKPIQETGDNSNVNATPNSNQKTPAKTSGSGGSDTVSLTSSATQLRELEARISDLPVVDVQRVSDVQRSLATGTLELSEADAAANLIEIEKSFS